MNARLLIVAGSLFTASVAEAQCLVDLPQDTVTLYWGYDPLACTTLTPVVDGALPTQLLWSNGSTAGSLTVCDTASSWYYVSLTDDTLCTSTDSVFVEVVDVHCGNNDNKVLVCHVPPGNPANAHTICISPNGVPAHLAHGCHLGACAAEADSLNGSDEVELMISPNPMTANTVVTVRSAVEQRVRVRVIDPLGRVHLTLLESVLGPNETRMLTLTEGQLPADAALMLIEASGEHDRVSRPVMLER